RHEVWTEKKLVVVEDGRLRLELPIDSASFESLAVAPSNHGIVTVRFDPKLGRGDSEFVQYKDGKELSRLSVPNIHIRVQQPAFKDGLFGLIVPPALNTMTRDSVLRWGSPDVPSEGFRIFVITSVVQLLVAALTNILLARRHRLSLAGHTGWALAGAV